MLVKAIGLFYKLQCKYYYINTFCTTLKPGNYNPSTEQKAVASAPMEPVNDFELVRQKNIERNNDFLKSLGLDAVREELRELVPAATNCPK